MTALDKGSEVSVNSYKYVTEYGGSKINWLDSDDQSWVMTFFTTVMRDVAI
jgi:hypothetical protein